VSPSVTYPRRPMRAALVVDAVRSPIGVDDQRNLAERKLVLKHGCLKRRSERRPFRLGLYLHLAFQSCTWCG